MYFKNVPLPLAVAWARRQTEQYMLDGIFWGQFDAIFQFKLDDYFAEILAGEAVPPFCYKEEQADTQVSKCTRAKGEM